MSRRAHWFDALHKATRSTTAFAPEPSGIVGTVEDGIGVILDLAHVYVESRGGRFILFGNGGSLAIAAHIATDFGLIGWPALALTDAVAFSSHANDFGIEAAFTKQLELLWGLNSHTHDVLIAMSCSGRSPDVLDAVRFAKARGNRVVTFSGFEPDNPLRLLGDLNFHTPSRLYGIVQLAHESILHAALDEQAGVTL